jgi:cyanoexosortase A
VQRGLLLVSPAGTVQVFAGCSGMESMTYLLGISVICMTLYPISRLKQIIAAITAVSIGFTINAVRVAIMATLAAPYDQTAFLFWHEGLGSLIFGVIEIVLFGLLYWLLYWLEMQQNKQKDHFNQG